MSAAAGASAALAVLALWWASTGGRAARRVDEARSARRWPTPRLRWRRSAGHDHAPLLDELGRRVRAGASLAEALGDACGPGAPAPLRAAVERHRRGLALADACRPLVDEADASMALVGATLCAVARFGGAGGRALDAAAAALRERSAVTAEVRAQAATARLSALVLAVLPLGFGGWTLATDAAARRFLLGSALGWVVAGAGVGLDALGAWWMHRIVRSAVGP